MHNMAFTPWTIFMKPEIRKTLKRKIIWTKPSFSAQILKGKGNHKKGKGKHKKIRNIVQVPQFYTMFSPIKALWCSM